MGFLFTAGNGAEFLIQRKPVAKIGPFLVGGPFGIGFRTIPPGTGQKKPAMAAGTEILPAGTAHAPSQGFVFGYGLSAIPAHDPMIAFSGQDCQGLTRAAVSTTIKQCLPFVPALSPAAERLFPVLIFAPSMPHRRMKKHAVSAPIFWNGR